MAVTATTVQPPAAGWRPTPGKFTSLLMLAFAIGGGTAVGVAIAIKPKIGIALVFGIALALVVLRRMEVGGLILVSLVPILSGIKEGYPIPSVRLTEALIGAIAAIIIVFLRRVRSLPWTRVEWLLASYAVVGIVLGLYDARQLSFHMNFQEYGTLAGPFQFFLLFRSIRLVLNSQRWRNLALRVLFLSSVPVSLLAIMQQVNVPTIRSFLSNFTGSDVLAGAASDYQTFSRATGPFPHWTPLAGYLVVILVTGLATILEPRCAPLSRRTLYAVLLLDAVGLMLSSELSAIFGLVVAVLLLGSWFGQLRRVLTVVGVALVVLAAVAGSLLAHRLEGEYSKISGTNHNSIIPQTVEFRFNIWEQQYFPAIAQRPIVGYGIVTPSMVVWPATESQYVTVLERGGATLMAVYVALMAGLFTAAIKVGRGSSDPIGRVTGYSVAALVIILIPMNAVFPYFEDSGLPQALWVLTGIMLAGVPGQLPRTGFLRLSRRETDVLPDPTRALSPPAAPSAISQQRLST